MTLNSSIIVVITEFRSEQKAMSDYNIFWAHSMPECQRRSIAVHNTEVTIHQDTPICWFPLAQQNLSIRKFIPDIIDERAGVARTINDITV